MASLGNSGYPLLLGKNPENSWQNQNGQIGNWIGAIDDVGIFSTALTSSEAGSIYALSTNKALAVCRTMKLSIHRGKELLAFKITCSNSFLPILFFLNESTGWNKRDGALKCAYTLIQTRHNRIFSTWFTQYMHPF